MKASQKLIVMTSLVSSVGFGSRGGNEDGDRTITCQDTTTQQVLLQFQGSAGQGTFENENFSVLVRSRGDDVGQVVLTDKNSGDTATAARSEELLNVSLTTDENPSSPDTVRKSTRMGSASVQLINQASGDQVFVESQSRRGVSVMKIKLITDESPANPISIICKKN